MRRSTTKFWTCHLDEYDDFICCCSFGFSIDLVSNDIGPGSKEVQSRRILRELNGLNPLNKIKLDEDRAFAVKKADKILAEASERREGPPSIEEYSKLVLKNNELNSSPMSSPPPPPPPIQDPSPPAPTILPHSISFDGIGLPRMGSFMVAQNANNSLPVVCESPHTQLSSSYIQPKRSQRKRPIKISSSRSFSYTDCRSPLNSSSLNLSGNKAPLSPPLPAPQTNALHAELSAMRSTSTLNFNITPHKLSPPQQQDEQTGSRLYSSFRSDTHAPGRLQTPQPYAQRSQVVTTVLVAILYGVEKSLYFSISPCLVLLACLDDHLCSQNSFHLTAYTFLFLLLCCVGV